MEVKPDQSLQWQATMREWVEPTSPLSSACCHVQSQSLLSHLPLPPFTLNKGTLNLSRELHIWVNVSVYHFHTVNYFVREIYCYPRMFGLGSPVHLEINKLLLEIPFVSQSCSQRTLLSINIQDNHMYMRTHTCGDAGDDGEMRDLSYSWPLKGP